MKVALALPGRSVEFEMAYDPNFAADVATLIYLERNGSCEPEVVHLMNRVLREGDFVVDAGANIGFFTLVMSQLVGPTGRVLSFEPGINNVCKLSDNVGLNKTRNVTMHAVALWSAAEEVTLHLAQDSGVNSLAPNAESISSVPMQAETLDAYCRGEAPRLIKIDVEGAEEHVLRGAEATLELGVPYITCELNAEALGRLDCTTKSLRQYVYEQGYQMFLLSTDGGLPAMVPPGTEVLTDRQNLNVLFSTVKDVELAYPEVRV